jgi:hypothetical protein
MINDLVCYNEKQSVIFCTDRSCMNSKNDIFSKIQGLNISNNCRDDELIARNV